MNSYEFGYWKNRADELERNLADARMLVWALITAAGGRIEIPMSLYEKAHDDANTIVRTPGPEYASTIYEAK